MLEESNDLLNEEDQQQQNNVSDSNDHELNQIGSQNDDENDQNNENEQNGENDENDEEDDDDGDDDGSDLNKSTQTDENNEIYDKSKTLNHLGRLLLECQNLRQKNSNLRYENNILKKELIKNGIKLESIEGLSNKTANRKRKSNKLTIEFSTPNDIKNQLNLTSEDEELLKKSNVRRSALKANKKLRVIQAENEADNDNDNDNELLLPEDLEIKKQLPSSLPGTKKKKISLKEVIASDEFQSLIENQGKDLILPGYDVPVRQHKNRLRPLAYQCTWPGCEKRFFSQYHRDSHERVHTNERPFKCKFDGCDFASKSKDTLAVHERRHTGQMPYKCSWPGCTFKSRQNSNMRAHMFQHTGEKPYKCDWPGCDREFVNLSTWQYHKKLHTDDKAFACTFPSCSRRFICRNDLKNHMAVHTGDRKHKCSWPGCDKSFIQKTNLNNHLRQHANERPFACDWPGCEWRSLTKNSLKKHRRTHTGERPYPCDKCERRFADESNLREHIRVVHEKVRRFICEYEHCGKRFSVRRLLNEHQAKEGHHVPIINGLLNLTT